MEFKNKADKRIFELITGIHLYSERLIQQNLKMLNMTAPQFRTMTILSQKDNITQREFATIIQADTTTVMVLCDSLEKKGWLKRVPDPTDRRANRLFLTESGKQIYAQALPLIQAIYNEYALNQVSIDELKAAIPALEKLYLNIRVAFQQAIDKKQN
jgi:MarR family transcriptional regulator for hemolysin